MYRLNSIVKDWHVAEDLYQDCCINIINSEYKDEGKFANYCIRVCRNTAITYLRKKKFLKLSELKIDLADEVTVESDVLNLLNISSITDKQRTIIKMKVLADCTFREISLMLRMNIETAKSHYYRGIAKISGHYKKVNI